MQQIRSNKHNYPRANVSWYGKERIFDEHSAGYRHLRNQHSHLLNKALHQLDCKNLERIKQEKLKGYGDWVEVFIEVLAGQFLEKSLRIGADNLVPYLDITDPGIIHEALKVKRYSRGKLVDQETALRALRRAKNTLEELGILCIGRGSGSKSENIPSLYVFRGWVNLYPKLMDDFQRMAHMSSQFFELNEKLDPVGFSFINFDAKMRTLKRTKQHSITLAVKTKDNEKLIKKLEERKANIERVQYNINQSSYLRYIENIIMNSGEADLRTALRLPERPLCPFSSVCNLKLNLEERNLKIKQLKYEKIQQVTTDLQLCESDIAKLRRANVHIEQQVHDLFAKDEPNLLRAVNARIAKRKAEGKDNISYPIELFKPRQSIWDLRATQETRLEELKKLRDAKFYEQVAITDRRGGWDPQTGRHRPTSQRDLNRKFELYDEIAELDSLIQNLQIEMGLQQKSTPMKGQERHDQVYHQ